MTKYLDIECDVYYEEGYELEDLKAAIAESIHENELEFTQRTGVLCVQTDQRALYSEGSLEVECIEFSSSDIFDEKQQVLPDLSGTIHVSFDYSAYYGCKDMDNSDQLEDSWAFKLSDKKLKFCLDIPQERYDEL